MSLWAIGHAIERSQCLAGRTAGVRGRRPRPARRQRPHAGKRPVRRGPQCGPAHAGVRATEVVWPAARAWLCWARVRSCSALHSITLGTRNRPPSWAGGVGHVGLTVVGLGDGVCAQAQGHVLDGRQRGCRGLDTRSVDRTHFSTMSKNSLSWVSIAACSSSRSSRRASWAMRLKRL